MPPLPALRIKALDDLATQLRFAPPDAARRQMERAEDLFAVITPAQAYPEDWLVYAITGYRPDMRSPDLIVGAALLGDLAAFVERLSAAAGLTSADLPGLHDPAPQWLDADQLCARWNISRKTLDRYRRRSTADTDAGVLPARRIRAASGRDKLYFSLRFVTDFESRRTGALSAAASFSRIDPALAARILRLAPKYRQRLGWSLNQTAQRLATRFNRGHETVRQLLRRHETPALPSDRVFSERGPLSGRERRVVARAHARGVDVDAIAARFQRTRSSIYRVLAAERADFLRSLTLINEQSHEFARDPRPGRADAALRAPSVQSGIGRPAPVTLKDMLNHAESDPLPDPRAERERSIAYWLLRADAARLIALLPRHNPAAGACDEIETRLRWASRLKAELVRSQLSLAFRTIRAGLEHDAATLPRAAAASLIHASMTAIIESTDHFDPSKGGRLAAPVGIALNRVVARWARAAPPHDPTRAAPFFDPATLPLREWTRHVDPWQRRLEPDPRVRRALPCIDPAHASFLAARFGWPAPGASTAAAPPATLAALAPRFNLTLHHASARERTAIVAALRAARAGLPAPTEHPRA